MTGIAIDRSTERDRFAAATFRKIALRIIPVLFICYILAYLDRVNIGFAKLGMKEEAWFSDAVFATGSGIFFIGYFLFEVPGNIMLHRVGARIWITRIMVSWGVMSALCSFSSSAHLFYLYRFLLGIAEAGFFPGVILYLTYWFPRQYRARMVALFMSAVALAGVVGSPLSGWLLDVTEGFGGRKSWQWLFILEGIPSILLGIALPFLLTDNPLKAKWLTTEEKGVVLEKLEEDEVLKNELGANQHGVGDAFRSWKVWVCCAVYFGLVVGLYGLSFWLPQILKNMFAGNAFRIGLYAAIPWGSATIGMILYSRHSDRTGERRWHVAGAAFVGALAFVVSGMQGISSIAVLIALSLGATAIMSACACFWSLPTAILSGAAAAAGIAWINSVGNLAGYLSPEMIAFLKKRYDIGTAVMSMGAFMGLSGILVLWVWRRRTPLS
jgi:MFS family permease